MGLALERVHLPPAMDELKTNVEEKATRKNIEKQKKLQSIDF